MRKVENLLSVLVNYNTLIKYQIKAYQRCYSDAVRIDITGEESLPELDIFKTDILETLQKGEYSKEFIDLINRIYLLSQSNSDLLVEYPIIRELYKNYPITKEIEKLSFGVFEFIYNQVFEAWDEWEKPITYNGFEDISTDIPEYWFKDDCNILWQTYYLTLYIVNASLRQRFTDFNNQRAFLPEEKISQFIEEQKAGLIEQITSLSQNFCDRNFMFSYLKGNQLIEKDYLTGYVLSDALAALNIEEYARYIKLDYSQYPSNYNWHFEKRTLKDYSDLISLPSFQRTVNLLTSIFLVKEIEEMEEENADEEAIEIEKDEITETPNQQEQTTEISQTEICSDIGTGQLEEETQPEEKANKNIPCEYIISVPILDLIYNEFNDRLWYDISLVEFLSMFTTAISKQSNFKLKSKQTTRFYYLLKKIWINSPNKSFFDTEKEWVIPFLKNYGLSYSAYTNQFIKNEGGLKHRDFIRETDKLLPKDEIE